MIDPNTMSIILNVVSTGICSSLVFVKNKSVNFVKHKSAIQQQLEQSEPLKLAIEQAFAAVSENTRLQDTAKTFKLQCFLGSQEVEAIMRQVFACRLLNEDTSLQNQQSDLRSEFLHLLCLRLGENEQSLKADADKLFDALLMASQKAIDICIQENPYLAAKDVKDAYRNRQLRDQLNALQQNVDFLVTKQQLTIEEVEEFEQKYRVQLKTKHGKITPTQTDSNERKDINKIYVSPSFVSTASEGVDNTALAMPVFLSSINRAVILGDPGGGKSTFTQKVCYDLATLHDKRPFANRIVTPFLVILREYGRRKVQQQCSILDFIVSTLNSDYQTPVKPEVVEYMLHNGRAIVLFDGLDELTETSDRQNIRDDVEAFCSRYPSVPVLVTSRFVGYEQAPLDDEAFLRFRLTSFNEEQVKEYVEKWFGALSHLSDEERQKKASAFLEESGSVPDLRSNPLMLALMCSIYRDEGTIPHNRPDVYEECASMLFDKWDKRRKITVSLAAAVQMRPTLEHLAHWIYSDAKLQEGVSEKALVEKATDYLRDYFKDREEARSAAQDFIHYCRDRAWVFTNTGSSRWNEQLYQFTHRTFLEYFTAQYLVRTNETTEALVKLLIPRIAKQEWDVVAQLAFQRKSQVTQGAADKLLLALVNASIARLGKAKIQLMSFNVRCLMFMRPSYQTVASVTRTCLEQYVTRQVSLNLSGNMYLISTHQADNFLALLMCMEENRQAVRDTLEKYLQELVDQPDVEIACNAAEIMLLMQYCFNDENKILGAKAEEFWTLVSQQLCFAAADRLLFLSSQRWVLCLKQVWDRNVTISQAINWYGFKNLFIRSESNIFGFHFLSFADNLFRGLRRKCSVKQVETLLQDLREFGYLCINWPLPWIHKNFTQTGWVGQIKLYIRPEGELEAEFAQIILVLLLEHEIGRADAVSYLEDHANPLAQLILSAIAVRENRKDDDALASELTVYGFTEDQCAFILRWARKEISFVAQQNSDVEEANGSLPMVDLGF